MAIFRVCMLAFVFCVACAAVDKPLPRFLDWFLGGGSRLEGIKIQYASSSGFYATSTRAIAPMEAVVVVHGSQVVSMSVVEKYIGHLISLVPEATRKRRYSEQFEMALFALHTLATKQDSFYPYFSSWASQCHNAFTFSNEVLSEFQHPTLEETVKSMRSEFLEQYRSYMEAMDGSLDSNLRAAFSKKRMSWAMCHVFSRIFGDVNLLGKTQSVLLPGCDMLNHDESARVALSTTDDGTVSMHVNRTGGYSAGNEVYNNYGDGTRKNFDLLLTYGFCVADNAADQVAIFELTSEPTREALQLISLPTQIAIPSSGEIDTLLPALRAAVLPDDTLQAVLQSSDSHKNKKIAIKELLKSSPVLDTEALQFLSNALTDFGRTLATSIEQDRVLLEVTEDGPVRQAVSYRLDFKKILRRARSHVARSHSAAVAAKRQQEGAAS